MMTGGQMLAEALVRHGVTDLFMIPGVQLDWAVDALRERAAEIGLFVPRHEQSTTYMADGYTRTADKPGVALVVPGPGALNAGAGLATAYASNSRVLFIASQIHSGGLGRGYGLLHEIKDQTGYIRGVTKWNHLVTGPDNIGWAIDEAFVRLREGRPRPVGIEIPHDYFSARGGDVGRHSTSEAGVECADPAAIQAAAALIDAARLPVLYAGGGVTSPRARAALRTLAEKIGAPVVMSDNGRGALSDRHPLAMNSLAGRAVFAKADLVVVVGSRFMDSLTPSPAWPPGGAKFVHINIDPDDLSPPRAPDVAIVADAADALCELGERVHRREALSTADAQRVRSWAVQQIARIDPQAAYIDAMRQALPEDGVFVNELTQVGYLARIAFPVWSQGTFIGPGYQGTLGYGLPTALGASIGAPGRRVLSITGDGGFGWSLQELATARRYRLPVTLVVFNDGHFGNVRAIQKRVFGQEVAVELTNPDFVLLARAFGIDATRVRRPPDLRAALKEAMSVPGPMLIEVKVDEMPSPWHLLRLRPPPDSAGPPAAPGPLAGSTCSSPVS